MTRKKKNWFVTLLVLGVVAVLSAMNASKILEWKNKIPVVKDLGNK